MPTVHRQHARGGDLFGHHTVLAVDPANYPENRFLACMFSIAAVAVKRIRARATLSAGTVRFDRYLIANLFIEENVNPGKEKNCIFLKGNAKIAFLSF